MSNSETETIQSCTSLCTETLAIPPHSDRNGLFEMLKKPLHGQNITTAIGTAASETDITLFGRAGLVIGAALSTLSIFNEADAPTRGAAGSNMAARIANRIAKTEKDPARLDEKRC